MSSGRMRQWAQAAAILAVAVPAMGIAVLAFREGAAESGGVSLNQAFHVILASTLVLLFVDFLTAIRRSGSAGMTFALGVGGFICCFVGAVVSEMFGPPALALLLAGAAFWAVVLMRSGSRRRAEPLRPRASKPVPLLMMSAGPASASLWPKPGHPRHVRAPPRA